MERARAVNQTWKPKIRKSFKTTCVLRESLLAKPRRRLSNGTLLLLLVVVILARWVCGGGSRVGLHIISVILNQDGVWSWLMMRVSSDSSTIALCFVVSIRSNKNSSECGVPHD